ncbi:hypothetical protein BV22DRAFT_1121588 [Leucogyrophana mollusca]|uniref:Uncharacterized protein n=1 Tax=Leucogyrophana mollusca TaxID=85980 RepID=A0ACB8B8X7_9AGAM|nr:hypothetical protein BV22DRAFT_1121588 [Leucogyrophana mollusca]
MIDQSVWMPEGREASLLKPECRECLSKSERVRSRNFVPQGLMPRAEEGGVMRGVGSSGNYRLVASETIPRPRGISLIVLRQHHPSVHISIGAQMQDYRGFQGCGSGECVRLGFEECVISSKPTLSALELCEQSSRLGQERSAIALLLWIYLPPPPKTQISYPPWLRAPSKRPVLTGTL